MARILIGNVKGPTGATGPQGVQGPRGVQGIQGPLPPLINNGLATVAGESALDAVMGKTLQDQITQQNSDKVDKAALVVSLIDISGYKNSGIVGTSSICYLQKYDKIAVITIGTVLLKYQTAGSNIIFTIPGHVPLIKTAITVRASNGSSYAGFIFGDSSNMAIQIDGLPTGDLYISGQFTVILE